MAKTPAHWSKQDLVLRINLAQPNGMTDDEMKEWGQEKAKALDEWNADLPVVREDAPVVCNGGPLVTSPISTAKPIPLPSETLEQTDFLKP